MGFLDVWNSKIQNIKFALLISHFKNYNRSLLISRACELCSMDPRVREDDRCYLDLVGDSGVSVSNSLSFLPMTVAAATFSPALTRIRMTPWVWRWRVGMSLMFILINWPLLLVITRVS